MKFFSYKFDGNLISIYIFLFYDEANVRFLFEGEGVIKKIILYYL